MPPEDSSSRRWEVGSPENRAESPEALRAQRESTAREFFASEFPTASPDKVEGYLSGIDFDKDVRVKSLKEGDFVAQHQDSDKQRGEAKGHWFSPVGEHAESLGIVGESSRSQSREPDFFRVTRNVKVLESTAKDIDMEYPTGGVEYRYGGGTQYTCGERDKGSFERIVDPDRRLGPPTGT